MGNGAPFAVLRFGDGFILLPEQRRFDQALRTGERSPNRRLIKLTNPEFVPYPDEDLVRSSRHLIRRAADGQVVLSAIASNPDWLVTRNTRHFTRAVAERTALRVATPAEFFRALSTLFR